MRTLERAFYNYGGSGRPTGEAQGAGLSSLEATHVQVQILSQVTLGALVTLRAGGQIIAQYGGVGTDDVVGRPFNPVWLSGAKANQLTLESSGTLFLEIVALSDVKAGAPCGC